MRSIEHFTIVLLVLILGSLVLAKPRADYHRGYYETWKEHMDKDEDKTEEEDNNDAEEEEEEDQEDEDQEEVVQRAEEENQDDEVLRQVEDEEGDDDQTQREEDVEDDNDPDIDLRNVLNTGESEEDTVEDGPGTNSKCNDTSDCPQFHFCFTSAFGGKSCQTNKAEDKLGMNCKRTGDEIPFPDHSICTAADFVNRKVDEERFSISRCFPEWDFRCAKAYYLPCTPNFTPEGELIEGEEKSCPENFSCKSQTYGDQEVDVCVPKEPEERAEICANHFDCGFSDLAQRWEICSRNVCLRVSE